MSDDEFDINTIDEDKITHAFIDIKLKLKQYVKFQGLSLLENFDDDIWLNYFEENLIQPQALVNVILNSRKNRK
jgi:hypothetical protein